MELQLIERYFAKLGLSPEIAAIYMALHTYGAQSISELARQSGIERTRIYRLMDDLTASNLVEVETQYKRSLFRAAPITNLQILISKKEQELRDLQTGLAGLQQDLQRQSLASPVTRVQMFQGVDGMKQMLWNQTKGTGENLSILYENMQTRTNLSFFERWVRACNDKKLRSRSIIGDNFIASQQAWYSKHTNERLALWEGRYVSNDLFPITHSMVIYDDVTSYFNWKDDEMFGIEVTNRQIADTQRRLFEMLWSQSVPVDDLKGPEAS